MMPNSDTECRIFLSIPYTHGRYFSCIPFVLQHSYPYPCDDLFIVILVRKQKLRCFVHVSMSPGFSMGHGEQKPEDEVDRRDEMGRQY